MIRAAIAACLPAAATLADVLLRPGNARPGACTAAVCAPRAAVLAAATIAAADLATTAALRRILLIGRDALAILAGAAAIRALLGAGLLLFLLALGVRPGQPQQAHGRAKRRPQQGTPVLTQRAQEIIELPAIHRAQSSKCSATTKRKMTYDAESSHE